MRRVEVKKVDVFTIKPFCGNPAGVVTQADGLSLDDMRHVAGEMSLSECAFISSAKSSKCDYRVRFFTQSTELDLSGHVLIASCFSMMEEGRIPVSHGFNTYKVETNVGVVPVVANITPIEGTEDAAAGDATGVEFRSGGRVIGNLESIMMHQVQSNYRPADISVDELADILGIDRSEITHTGLPIEIAPHGLVQLVVPVRSSETLLGMHPDLIRLNLLNRKHGIDISDIFTTDTVSQDCTVYSRHFAPSIGLWEDPGSGSGAACLCAYLVKHGLLNPGTMIVEQGNNPACLVRIHVEVGRADGEKIPVSVGGLAVTSIIQTVEVEGAPDGGAARTSSP
ncbi:MAG: PhzF family phenazine biosynthesis protein [bacterium]|nr:MAG: PhzF family phenazine biosynthesis protein [bacterium]